MAMRVIIVSAADVRRAWADRELTLAEAAASLGVSVDCLQDRAAALGLKQRRTGRREAIRPHQEPEFRLMWRAGVSARSIGQRFGCSYFAVINTAIRVGLPQRGVGFKPPMTLDQYAQAKLGLAMASLAAAEKAGARQ
jgi:hypothetical protein